MSANILEVAEGITTIECAFCKGGGRDPFLLLSPLAICQTCRGKGTVQVREPVRSCAFCGGSGVYPHSRLTCTVCGGRGVVTVREPAGLCVACMGSGQTRGSGLPCLECRGKGVIEGG